MPGDVRIMYSVYVWMGTIDEWLGGGGDHLVVCVVVLEAYLRFRSLLLVLLLDRCLVVRRRAVGWQEGSGKYKQTYR